MIETVHVNLPGRAYDVVIGPNLLAEAGPRITPFLRRPRVVIVTEENVAKKHLAQLTTALEGSGIASESLVLPAGEGTKSWPFLEQTVEFLLAHKVERGDIVVAFGGGVIGDLVGFAASTVRRGVRFVQMPTSLLAQVDSSVGGKTGINSPSGKNLIGAFHQPTLVLADTSLLDTLTERDFLSGYGEVVKYGLLGDAAFFEWLEAEGPVLKGSGVKSLLTHTLSADKVMEARVRAVTRSVQMKADIVERDETEQGDRALLNLGHTFCHALEAATGYGDRLLHGEGVAIGCAMAFEVSARLGLCSQEDPSRVRAHLADMGMKRDLKDITGDLPDAQALMALMAQDKKVLDGKLRFILARGLGAAFVTAEVPPDVVLDVVSEQLADR